ncbi:MULTISPECIES: metallophosphoesterase [unclassified Cryobacterium]|uniref:metallophosphoesterase family protein n=1 Tax=unclassified Cryobacterium TaxID=2649013 RepID=UPI0013048ABC|nr:MULTISPECIES: metallophosphoesterase [unclassified Cryobacterium]
MGDLHGDLEHALQAFSTFAARGVRCILQLGDWGIIWPGGNWQADLRKISRALARHHMVMFWVEGNHEYYPKLLNYPVDADGVRWITSNIGHLPRGYRTQIGGQFILAALGGANSIDRRLREEGVSWWPDEQISDADLRRLGSERVDVLVGHEAPLMDECALDRSAQESGFSPVDVAYAAASRVMFRRAVLQTRPRLTLGGHYHRFYDQTLTVPGETSSTRVVVLDMNGKCRVNMAILNTTTLDLEFMYRNGASVQPEIDTPERNDNDQPEK